mmetsp:Transcript_62139/g.189737  ORF Transcript_62139/g.189737 Transcript_62139/m.189737 type:complete len:699 (+) Transcript_62139:22-2118(+)
MPCLAPTAPRAPWLHGGSVPRRLIRELLLDIQQFLERLQAQDNDGNEDDRWKNAEAEALQPPERRRAQEHFERRDRLEDGGAVIQSLLRGAELHAVFHRVPRRFLYRQDLDVDLELGEPLLPALGRDEAAEAAPLEAPDAARVLLVHAFPPVEHDGLLEPARRNRPPSPPVVREVQVVVERQRPGLVDLVGARDHVVVREREAEGAPFRRRERLERPSELEGRLFDRELVRVCAHVPGDLPPARVLADEAHLAARVVPLHVLVHLDVLHVVDAHPDFVLVGRSIVDIERCIHLSVRQHVFLDHAQEDSDPPDLRAGSPVGLAHEVQDLDRQILRRRPHGLEEPPSLNSRIQLYHSPRCTRLTRLHHLFPLEEVFVPGGAAAARPLRGPRLRRLVRFGHVHGRALLHLTLPRCRGPDDVVQELLLRLRAEVPHLHDQPPVLDVEHGAPHELVSHETLLPHLDGQRRRAGQRGLEARVSVQAHGGARHPRHVHHLVRLLLVPELDLDVPKAGRVLADVVHRQDIHPDRDVHGLPKVLHGQYALLRRLVAARQRPRILLPRLEAQAPHVALDVGGAEWARVAVVVPRDWQPQVEQPRVNEFFDPLLRLEALPVHQLGVELRELGEHVLADGRVPISRAAALESLAVAAPRDAHDEGVLVDVHRLINAICQVAFHEGVAVELAHGPRVIRQLLGLLPRRLGI